MPQKIRASCYFGKYHEIEVEDDVSAFMEYENGTTGVFVTSTADAPGTNRLEIAGDYGKLVVEGNRIQFYKLEVSERQFNKEWKGALFGSPKSNLTEVPYEGDYPAHKGITKSWVDSILDGTPLIAAGYEGIHGVILANAMMLSAWTDNWVELPMDEELYIKLLKEKINQSPNKKSAGIQAFGGLVPAMKISFTTLSCPDWSWDRIIHQAAQLGYNGIEIRGIQGEMSIPKMLPFQPENILKSMNDLKSRDLCIRSLGTSVIFHDPAKFEQAIMEGKDAIDIAEKLGTPYIRVFGDQIINESSIPSVAKGLDTLGRYCEGKNVVVLLETHGQFNRIESLSSVFDLFQNKNVGILWDIEHTYRIYGNDIEEFYERFKNLIRHTHIKDVKKSGDKWALCLIGTGEIDIVKIMNLLKKSNFDVWLSLEWEKKGHPELEEPETAIPSYIEYIKGKR